MQLRRNVRGSIRLYQEIAAKNPGQPLEPKTDSLLLIRHSRGSYNKKAGALRRRQYFLKMAAAV